MGVTGGDGELAGAWADAGRKLRKVFPRRERDAFDALVLGLLHPARPRPLAYAPAFATPDPGAERDLVRARLEMGVSTAAVLARECADPEVLAAVVALPWYDGAVGARQWLLRERPLDWAAAMVLAMIPVEARTLRRAGDPPPAPPAVPVPPPAHLRQLAALPPLLRGAVLTERSLAGDIAAQRRTFPPRLPLPLPRPWDDAELSFLAPDVPRSLLPSSAHPPQPREPVPDPVGGPAEAIALVRARPPRFGAHTMWVDGGFDTGYLVEGQELVYQVRWDAPPEAIRPGGPVVSNPGDQPTPPPREPAWIVDRVTRHVDAVDLAGLTLREFVDPRRAFPLPPGWRPEGRPPLPEGLAATAPPAVHSAAAPVLHEATTRYAAALATEAWPDFLVAWRVAVQTVRELATVDVTDPESVTAALLAARGSARADTLVDDASPLWRTPAGELARLARPEPEETDGEGVARRAARIAQAPPPVRVLALANARARSTVEAELFGVVPRARQEEIDALRR
ncbi:hypothetical protein RB614_25035 [Phytohabitans sp. ZYX-F-186]|uniref:Uncharacterized protein n=1 Tax=Phytohabitans maris TaxID=3071409 RepID=A0ABU0ZMC8_9ACTN|nr:hypothetical protein [Phytohabitans sp. ZYX-F-186]MDQ7907791.1 hypothetical protein [Phytohabitans sp. ZYX-F-186]